MPDTMFVKFATVLKYDEQPDGSLKVYGKATDETYDSDKQKVNLDWSSKALTEWLATGANLRVQHSHLLYPAGVGLELELKDDGAWLVGHVVDPTAIIHVKAKSLTAYSIGIHWPKIVYDDPNAPGGTIVGGEIFEVSLVDRPANPSCKFQIVKSAGADEPGVLDWRGSLLTAKVKSTAGAERLSVLAPVHALLCPAQASEAVKAAHPDLVKDGLRVLGSAEVMSAVYGLLSERVAKDAGTGEEAWSIKQWSDVYADLRDLVSADNWEAVYELAETLDTVKAAAATHVRDGVIYAGKDEGDVLVALHNVLATALPGLCELEVSAEDMPADEADEPDGDEAEPEEDKAAEPDTDTDEESSEGDAEGESEDDENATSPDDDSTDEETEDTEDTATKTITAEEVATIVKSQIEDIRKGYDDTIASLQADIARLGGEADMSGAPRRNAINKNADAERRGETFADFVKSVASNGDVQASETARAVKI